MVEVRPPLGTTPASPDDVRVRAALVPTSLTARLFRGLQIQCGVHFFNLDSIRPRL